MYTRLTIQKSCTREKAHFEIWMTTSFMNVPKSIFFPSKCFSPLFSISSYEEVFCILTILSSPFFTSYSKEPRQQKIDVCVFVVRVCVVGVCVSVCECV